MRAYPVYVLSVMCFTPPLRFVSVEMWLAGFLNCSSASLLVEFAVFQACIHQCVHYSSLC